MRACLRVQPGFELVGRKRRLAQEYPIGGAPPRNGGYALSALDAR